MPLQADEDIDMKSSLPLKLLLDGCMILLFLLLMADRYTGNSVHEYSGLVLTGGLFLHGWMNRSRIKMLLKGRYSFSRSIRLLMNLLLLTAAVGTLGSAVVISNTVFLFPGLQGELFSRKLHVFFAHWSFILAAGHTGIYWNTPAAMLNRTFLPPQVNRVFLVFAAAVIAVYGAYAFMQRELAYPLTMRSAFMMWSENEGILLFILDYSAIFFLCAGAVHALFGRMNPIYVRRRPEIRTSARKG